MLPAALATGRAGDVQCVQLPGMYMVFVCTVCSAVLMPAMPCRAALLRDVLHTLCMLCHAVQAARELGYKVYSFDEFLELGRGKPTAPGERPGGRGRERARAARGPPGEGGGVLCLGAGWERAEEGGAAS